MYAVRPAGSMAKLLLEVSWLVIAGTVSSAGVTDVGSTHPSANRAHAMRIMFILDLREMDGDAATATATDRMSEHRQFRAPLPRVPADHSSSAARSE